MPVTFTSTKATWIGLGACGLALAGLVYHLIVTAWLNRSGVSGTEAMAWYQVFYGLEWVATCGGLLAIRSAFGIAAIVLSLGLITAAWGLSA